MGRTRCLLHWLRVFLTLAVLGHGCGARRLRQAPSTSSSSQQLALLAFAEGFSNFQTVANNNHFNGWSASSVDPCSGSTQVERDSAQECFPWNSVYKSADRNPWTGVTCNAAGRVTCIQLDNLGIRGAASNILALSKLQDLAALVFSNNHLSGLLPVNLGSQLQNVSYLFLGGNDLNGSLPATWGSEDVPNLRSLQLSDNDFAGGMPSAWGRTDSFTALRVLLLNGNRLSGRIPESYSQANGAWPALQIAVLEPGNQFCGSPPQEFPAFRQTGQYITGAVRVNITTFNYTCDAYGNTRSAILVPDDSLGHNLSEAAVAGIITGEVVLGLVLLVIAGIFHRRYRWRQERSWVLFDWDVVQEPKPPRSFNFHHRFAWFHQFGSERSQSEGTGSRNAMFSPAGSANGFGETAVNSSNNGFPVQETLRENLADKGERKATAKEAQSKTKGVPRDFLPMNDWREVMFEPHEVRLQQNTDGSLKALGNGSFGKVYKGVCQNIHECAVKVFEGYTGRQERELLLQEISILRSCRAENVVQFFGVCLQKNDIWMVMELMEGNLYRHLARGHHCTWYFRGRSIAIDIARGMEYLHKKQIIHMDLKSPNILIGETGIAKVADVGLARVMGSESLVSQMCAGTMHWMAPEVLVQGQCTEKADIFSFGVILWEICTGEAPTRGRMSTVSVPDECPKDVADLIDACMEEEPDKRPSATEIISRIQSIPITTRPVPQPPWYAR